MIEKKNVEVVYLDKYEIMHIKKKIDSVKKLYSAFNDDLIFWERSIEALTSGEYVLLLYRTKDQGKSEPGFNMVSYGDLNRYSDFPATYDPGVRHSFDGRTSRRGIFVKFTGLDENNYLFIGTDLNGAEKLQKDIQYLTEYPANKALIKMVFSKRIHLTSFFITRNLTETEIKQLMEFLENYKTKIRQQEIKDSFLRQLGQAENSFLENFAEQEIGLLIKRIIDPIVPDSMWDRNWRELRREIDNNSGDLIVEFEKGL